MKTTLFAAIACLVALSGVRAAEGLAEGQVPKVVTVDAATQSRLGVSVVSLAVAAMPSVTTTTARVLDPGTLLQLDKDLATASAGFTASRDIEAQVKKAYSEDRTASHRDVQAAHEQEVMALQKVNAARRQLAMVWGGGIPADMQAHTRAELLSDIAGSRVELARVELPAGTGTPKVGASLQVPRAIPKRTPSSAASSVRCPRWISSWKPVASLVKLKGDAARLPIGQSLTAEIPGSSSSGVLGVILPRASLLRHESRVWECMCRAARRPLCAREVPEVPAGADKGWISLSKRFGPGDPVVAAGAAALLGVEVPGAADPN